MYLRSLARRCLDVWIYVDGGPRSLLRAMYLFINNKTNNNNNNNKTNNNNNNKTNNNNNNKKMKNIRTNK